MVASGKTPVRLRKRTTRSGNTSLYLDIYWKGRRKYEYLNLYLIPENTRADRERNRETMRLAEAICAKRLVEFRNGVYGFEDDSGGDVLLEDYFLHAMEQRREGTRELWEVALMHLRKYGIRNMKLSHVDGDFMNGFLRYLRGCRSQNNPDRKISTNSVNAYYSALRAVMNQAYREGLVREKISERVDALQKGTHERTYLTIEELKTLAATPYRVDVLRRAFLFGCMTGLRRSDILALRWGDVSDNGDFKRITFRQKKTGQQEYYDIAPKAKEYMGERRGPKERVFEGFTAETGTSNRQLREWAQAAGIEKHITFHSSRHTFATLMLEQGVDLYTVSKLLGHTNITTTQIYAKIVDKKKQAAVLQFPEI